MEQEFSGRRGEEERVSRSRQQTVGTTVDQAALRLLRRMAVPGARLARRGEGWRLLASGQDQAAEMAAVRTLRSAGLVEADDAGGLRLSKPGIAALRRALSGGDFSAQHQERAVRTLTEEGGARPVTVDLAESPLAWLASRKDRDGRPLIDQAAFQAGERLRADFTRGQMTPRVTANWSAAVASGRRSGEAGGMADLTDAALAARMRVERALDAVGPELAGVLLDVCCFLRGIEEVEAAEDWPRRSGKLVLRLALSALARHYGLATEARRGGRAPIRHWGTADYRPSIG